MRLFVIFLMSVQLLFSQNIVLLTEDFSPFNYRDKGKTTGIAVDLLKHMFEISGMEFNEKDIILDKWSSSFSRAVTDSNSILFSTTRLPAREDLFKWIGPIMTSKIAIISKKRNNIKISSATDLSKYKIATPKNAAPEKLFENMGGSLSNVVRVSTPLQTHRLLEYDRIDAFVGDSIPFLSFLQENNLNVDDYEIVLTLKKGELYFSANRAMNPEIISKLQNALNLMKKVNPDTKKSIYGEVVSKYMSPEELSTKH